MKLKEIYRTSTFAWCPKASLPLLATGTVAGALDESFSNESQLEIWAPNFDDWNERDLGGEGQHGPRGSVKDSARFNRLAWGAADGLGRSRGVIAAGMENGELALWDPEQIFAGASTADSLILRNTTHTGPVRGLDFNPLQTNLLASGGVNGEVYIWDLKDPTKPYTPTPGARSTKLDEITSVAWNRQVQYVLAGASSTGYTVVWDLRGKREVVALAYGGGAGTLAGQVGSGSGLAVGGRRGMSDIAWHPDNATRVVTASEDDSSPIIMVWDLRNARAPEKILTGHEKGVLSLSWCQQDADLLLSCGKDNRALCWNPQTSEVIGELPSADNWAFQVDWCPTHPDLLATAFFDGTIGIHSIQSTNEASTTTPAAAQADGADIFDAPGFSRASQGGTLSLKQPPKWLRRPVSNSFGFGGKLVTVSNLPSAQGKNQSSTVHIRKVVTEEQLVERASQLQAAVAEDSLKDFAASKVDASDNAKSGDDWKALLSLFKANSRDELVTLLGFSKSEIAAKVAEAVATLKTSQSSSEVVLKSEEDDTWEERIHEPVVSFAEPERDDSSEEHEEKTPSETSVGVTSDTASASRGADRESMTTVPSLFGDDVGPGTPQLDAGADFFSQVQSGAIDVPHTNYGIDSSVAATIGSGPSSVASEVIKSNTFRIYPADESETDRLVTKALVLGDFESAVSLCLSSDRFADAILLAVRGGPDLLQRTQKAYFERRTTALPYLRLFQSIVSNDLSDIVQNADLQEWQEIFVVLCTFANQEEFAGLAEQLGQRLEFQFTVACTSEEPRELEKAHEYRKNATLTYLAAGRLERLVSIWSDELLEEEQELITNESRQNESHYSAHAHALETFVEKVTVFRSATKYQDADLSTPSTSDPGLRTFKLSTLYDRYLEYADLLVTQGLAEEAVAFVKLTPASYKGSAGADTSSERERLLAATGATPVVAATIPVAAAAAKTATAPTVTPYTGYNSYTSQQQTANVYAQAPTQTAYSPYAATNVATTAGGYAPQVANASPYAPVTSPYAPTNPYSAQNSLTQPPHLRTQVQAQVPIPPPPRPGNGPTSGGAAPLPPPKRAENGGWNDAPSLAGAARGPTPLNTNKPPAITSPFPNATPSPGAAPPGSPYNQQQGGLPPPPRPGSVQAQGRASVPPPPQGQRLMQGPPPPQQVGYVQQGRPPSRTAGPPNPGMNPGVGRINSPLQGQVPPRQPTPSQYAPPPRGQSLPQGGPPGPYGRPQEFQGGQPPQQQQQHGPPIPGNPYARATPPPPGPYAPTGQPSMQQQQQMQPLPPSGPYAPPPGAQRGGPPPGGVGGGMQQQQQLQQGPPPPPGGPGGPPRAATAPRQTGPPPPKYPVGDRSHIPETSRPAFNVISEHLNVLKQTTPPQQKRLVDDLERRISPLFDALNCETLSQPVVEQLLVLTRAMESRDRPAALAIHVDLLTRGSQTDDIGLWMSGIKQLIMRL